METSQKSEFKSYIVPMDILMDIFRIIFKNDLRHRVEGINEKQNYVMLRVYLPSDSNFGKSAHQNIQSILSDYGYYMNAGPNEQWDDENDDENSSS